MGWDGRPITKGWFDDRPPSAERSTAPPVLSVLSNQPIVMGRPFQPINIFPKI